MKLPILTTETMSVKGKDLLDKIKADFIGKNYPTAAHEHIHVLLKETDNIEEVNIVEY